MTSQPQQQRTLTYAVPIDAFFLKVGPTQATGEQSIGTIDSVRIVDAAEDVLKRDIKGTNWGNGVEVDLVSLDGGVSNVVFEDGFSEWAQGGGIVAFVSSSFGFVPTVDDVQTVVETSLNDDLLFELQGTPYSYLTEFNYTLVTVDNAPTIVTNPPAPAPEPVPEITTRNANGEDDSPNLAAILGGVLGGLALVAIVLIVAWQRRRRRYQQQEGAFPDKVSDELPGVYVEPMATASASFAENMSMDGNNSRSEVSPLVFLPPHLDDKAATASSPPLPQAPSQDESEQESAVSVFEDSVSQDIDDSVQDNSPKKDDSSAIFALSQV